MPNDSEEISIDMIIEIFMLWDKMYPDRLSPGEVSEHGHWSYDLNEDNKETPIQRRIRKAVTHNRGYKEYIAYRINPELAPKKHYSDDVPIDWNNIFMSNLEYHKRVEEHEYNLPGIEKIVPLYFHIKEC